MLSAYLICTILTAAAATDTIAPLSCDSIAADNVIVVGDTAAMSQPDDDVELFHATSNPWRAAAETAALNLGILAFDHYVMDFKFAKVTWHTIGRNFSPRKWYWDGDIFRTNLVEHPYHGSLYFDAARANGLNFYQSIPFAAGGSLMWEIAGECEQPSINDFLATSFGGIAIGEVTHRLSLHVFDNRKTGFERVLREVVGTIIDPMQSFNRLITGQSWRHSGLTQETIDERATATTCAVTLSARRWGTAHRAKNGASLDIRFEHGSPVNEDNSHPYDYFTADVGIASGQTESFVSRVNVTGLIHGWSLHSTDKSASSFGIYQHFNYMVTDSIDGRTPYRISEAACLGVGLAHRLRLRHWTVDDQFFVNATLLGGALTDYRDNRQGRDYNLGSGYGMTAIAQAERDGRLRLRLQADMKHLFSYHGYEDEDNSKDYWSYSVMGDRGNTLLVLVQPELSCRLWSRWHLACSALWVFRKTHYTYHTDKGTSSHAFDARIGLQYRF